MMRTVAAILVAFQMLGFAQPAQCSAGAHEEPECEHASPPDRSAVDAGDACEACGVAGCNDMATCVAPVPALAAFGRVEWTEASLVQVAAPAIDRPIRISRPPIRPPPRV